MRELEVLPHRTLICTPGKAPAVPIVEEAVWNPEPVLKRKIHSSEPNFGCPSCNIVTILTEIFELSILDMCMIVHSIKSFSMIFECLKAMRAKTGLDQWTRSRPN
jgi:hypothetical protein